MLHVDLYDLFDESGHLRYDEFTIYRWQTNFIFYAYCDTQVRRSDSYTKVVKAVIFENGLRCLYETTMGPTTTRYRKYDRGPGLDIGFDWARTITGCPEDAEHIAIVRHPCLFRLTKIATISVVAQPLSPEYYEAKHYSVHPYTPFQAIVNVLCQLREQALQQHQSQASSFEDPRREWIARLPADVEEEEEEEEEGGARLEF